MFNTCENTMETHTWFADKFDIHEDQSQQHEEKVVYMRFTRMGIFYKNTHYFFTGTKTDLNNFMLERKKEIDEAKKELGFGRGDHDNLWDTPLDTWQGGETPHDDQVFERAEPFGFERAEPSSNWKLYLYANEEEFKSALHLLEIQTHKGRINGFPDEIIYINQINK